MTLLADKIQTIDWLILISIRDGPMHLPHSSFRQAQQPSTGGEYLVIVGGTEIGYKRALPSEDSHTTGASWRRFVNPVASLRAAERKPGSA